MKDKNKSQIIMHKRIKKYLLTKIGLKLGGNSTKYDRIGVRLSTGRFQTICVLARPEKSYKKFINLLGFYSSVVNNINTSKVEKTSSGFGVLSRFFIIVTKNNFNDSMDFINLVKKNIIKFEENKIKNKKENKADKAKKRNKTKKDTKNGKI